jgi:hypothetical protein
MHKRCYAAWDSAVACFWAPDFAADANSTTGVQATPTSLQGGDAGPSSSTAQPPTPLGPAVSRAAHPATLSQYELQTFRQVTGRYSSPDLARGVLQIDRATAAWDHEGKGGTALVSVQELIVNGEVTKVSMKVGQAFHLFACCTDDECTLMHVLTEALRSGATGIGVLGVVNVSDYL